MRLGSATPLAAHASDVGGGVRELSVRVDGRVVRRASAGGTCADVDPSNAQPFEYNVMKPCPASLASPLTLAASQMPDNDPHTVTVVATDAGGQ